MEKRMADEAKARFEVAREELRQKELKISLRVRRAKEELDAERVKTIDRERLTMDGIARLEKAMRRLETAILKSSLTAKKRRRRR